MKMKGQDMKKKKRELWVAREFDNDQYLLFDHEPTLDDTDEDWSCLCWIEHIFDMCPRDFEAITGIVLAAGQYCKLSEVKQVGCAYALLTPNGVEITSHRTDYDPYDDE
jgi:hypothetical protein